MTLTNAEIASQPQVWQQAITLAPTLGEAVTRRGARVLAIGCGTSAFIAEAYAALRETAGFGITDAAYASEPWPWRDYDAVLAITRSGTTTEVLDALGRVPDGVAKVVVTGVADSPCARAADEVVVLDFADESSVVQTRFPTTFLALLRAALGEDLSGLPARAEAALGSPPSVLDGDFDHFVYLGRGWTHGLAQEAALKIREAAQAWAESYPVLDYRHGPMAVAHPGSLVWLIGVDEPDLAEQIVQTTGARVVSRLADDPLIELALAQQLAVRVAASRGLNPDSPRYLTRAVVLG